MTPTCISYRIVVLSSLSPTQNSMIIKLVDLIFKEVLPMVFSGIRAFLLNPLKINDINHVLSELVLQ
jgi:hypothetical protein